MLIRALLLAPLVLHCRVARLGLALGVGAAVHGAATLAVGALAGAALKRACQQRGQGSCCGGGQGRAGTT